MDGAQVFRVTVTADLAGIRADRAAASLLNGFSRSKIQRSFAANNVWRDDEVISQKALVGEGDELSILIPRDQPSCLCPVSLVLPVIHEDAEIIVIDKPSGMVVHPGAGTGEDTLVHGLLHHCGEAISHVGSAERPGIVHRLDKETSGVIVAAKTSRAYECLSRAFADRQTGKGYTALVSGSPRLESGVITKAIGRSAHNRTRMAIATHGRPAHTEWTVDRRFGTVAAKLNLTILTGRTHQIRVHLSNEGHPVLGDAAYGYRPGKLNVDVPRVMLHAERLTLPHPSHGQPVTFHAPLPVDFLELMARLEAIQGRRG